MNFKQMKAIEQVNKKRIISSFGDIPDESGIYVFYRKENGFNYAYVGQAKKLLTRVAQHLSGYSHIDLSLKKRGFFKLSNENGWNLVFTKCNEEYLDESEKAVIKQYAGMNYQLYNKTTGGQGKGKKQLTEYKEAKGYRQGVENGKESLQKELRYILDKYLVISLQKENKLSQNALKKFYDLLGE